MVWSKEYCPAFLDENKARERVNTFCISRERNEVLVKNAEQDHGSHYSQLAYHLIRASFMVCRAVQFLVRSSSFLMEYINYKKL